MAPPTELTEISELLLTAEESIRPRGNQYGLLGASAGVVLVNLGVAANVCPSLIGGDERGRGSGKCQRQGNP
jgi:hypothetical protein